MLDELRRILESTGSVTIGFVLTGAAEAAGYGGYYRHRYGDSPSEAGDAAPRGRAGWSDGDASAAATNREGTSVATAGKTEDEVRDGNGRSAGAAGSAPNQLTSAPSVLTPHGDVDRSWNNSLESIPSDDTPSPSPARARESNLANPQLGGAHEEPYEQILSWTRPDEAADAVVEPGLAQGDQDSDGGSPMAVDAADDGGGAGLDEQRAGGPGTPEAVDADAPAVPRPEPPSSGSVAVTPDEAADAVVEPALAQGDQDSDWESPMTVGAGIDEQRGEGPATPEVVDAAAPTVPQPEPPRSVRARTVERSKQPRKKHKRGRRRR